ncbi:MAG: NPCBM/NEW2 domain-containing protein [Planctomycetes bacterium]|nr:NPCBM/NEW2 domain-containing protein [Planctomycetota bacterium]
MTRGFFILLIAAASSAVLLQNPEIAPASTSPSKIYLPDDLESTLWARSPMLHNPTSLDCDARGRIWIAEAVNYRGFNTKSANPLWREKGDRIVVLEDSNETGRADRSWTFIEDPDLVAPLGIAVIGNRIFVSCSPSLIVYTDVNNNAVFDPGIDTKEIFLTGFGGFDHDHSLHSAVGGPDGMIYCNVGNAGPHIVRDRAGFTVRAGSSYTGGTPYNTKNQPGLVSDDGRVWVGGFAFKIDPGGAGLAVIGHNFRNSYEVCADSFGNIWQNDNDDEISCRVTWLMEGGNAGYSSADGAREWQVDRRPGQSLQNAHWRQDDPGVMPSGDVYGAGSPTGIVYYENGALPKHYEGLLLSCEAGRNLIWAYWPKAHGAGFAYPRSILLSSVDHDNPNYVWHEAPDDPAKWFRPSDVCIGSNGALYVADWYDPIVGGHQMRDKIAEGSIYKIAAKGQKTTNPKIDLSTPGGAVDALRNPSPNVRFSALLAIYQFGESAAPPLLKLLDDSNIYIRARALWPLARVSAGADATQRVAGFLNDNDPRIAIAAFRAMRAAGRRTPEMDALALHADAAVRREVALAARGAKNIPLTKQLADRYPSGDRAYLEALGAAAEGIEAEIYRYIIKKEPDNPRHWNVNAAEIVWRLHPVESVDALRTRALDPHLNINARIRAIDALAFINDRTAAESILQIACGGPADARENAAWWIRHPDKSDWNKYGLAKLLPAAPSAIPDGFPKPPGEPAWKSDILRKGFVNFDVEVAGAAKIWLVADDGGDGPSCDWADWLGVEFDDGSGAVPIVNINYTNASTGWGTVGKNHNCSGGALRVEGSDLATGYGAHANSVLIFNIPEAMRKSASVRLRGAAGVDRGGPAPGGSDHESHSSSIQFSIYNDGPSPRDRAAALAAHLIDPALAAPARIAAAQALAAFGEGGETLLALAEKNTIPEDARAAIAELIFKNPDASIRSRASHYFKRTGAAAALPPVDSILKIQGDPVRGRAVFMSQKAACSSCHAFGNDGRSVGPTLTSIGEKYDRAALLDAVLNPSAVILAGYETQVVLTKNGGVYTGIARSNSDMIELTDSAGIYHSIPRADVADQYQQNVSLMPDNIAMGLSVNEIADLLSFLMAKPKSK